MIDIHSHLLPGVDDGSRTIAQSVEVLQRFGTEGVEVLVCTPHLNASAADQAPYELHERLLADLRAAAPPRPELRLGWEIMLDVPGVDLAAPHFGLAGSRAVLVEFPRTGVPQGAGGELARLRMSGVMPVLAHPERYWACTLDQVRAWRGHGAAIQTDATVLLGKSDIAGLARAMLEEGLVDCLASDNHGDARSLGAVRAWLVEIGAEEQAHILTHANPARLLAGQDPLPVAPIPAEPGLLGRLRELLFGGRRDAP